MRLKWLHAQALKQELVFIRSGVGRGQKFFTNKNRIGPGKEAECDGFGRELLAAGGESHSGSGHQNARGGDGANHFERVKRRYVSKRCALDANEHVDGNAFGMRLQISQLVKQADAVSVFFAHAENASAANGDARFADRSERAQALIVNTRGDDGAVEFRRSIEIVVIGGEGRVFQTESPALPEHAARAADLHAQPGEAPNPFEDFVT